MFLLCLWCIYDIFLCWFDFFENNEKTSFYQYKMRKIFWTWIPVYVNLCLLTLIYKCVASYRANKMETQSALGQPQTSRHDAMSWKFYQYTSFMYYTSADIQANVVYCSRLRLRVPCKWKWPCQSYRKLQEHHHWFVLAKYEILCLYLCD